VKKMTKAKKEEAQRSRRGVKGSQGIPDNLSDRSLRCLEIKARSFANNSLGVAPGPCFGTGRIKEGRAAAAMTTGKGSRVAREEESRAVDQQ
jgi:hypothetical protein